MRAPATQPSLPIDTAPTPNHGRELAVGILGVQHGGAVMDASALPALLRGDGATPSRPAER